MALPNGWTYSGNVNGGTIAIPTNNVENDTTYQVTVKAVYDGQVIATGNCDVTLEKKAGGGESESGTSSNCGYTLKDFIRDYFPNEGKEEGEDEFVEPPTVTIPVTVNYPLGMLSGNARFHCYYENCNYDDDGNITGGCKFDFNNYDTLDTSNGKYTAYAVLSLWFESGNEVYCNVEVTVTCDEEDSYCERIYYGTEVLSQADGSECYANPTNYFHSLSLNAPNLMVERNCEDNDCFSPDENSDSNGESDENESSSTLSCFDEACERECPEVIINGPWSYGQITLKRKCYSYEEYWGSPCDDDDEDCKCRVEVVRWLPEGTTYDEDSYATATPTYWGHEGWSVRVFDFTKNYEGTGFEASITYYMDFYCQDGNLVAEAQKQIYSAAVPDNYLNEDVSSQVSIQFNNDSRCNYGCACCT